MRLFSKFAFRELSVMTAALSFFSCQGFAAGEEGKDDKIKPAVLMFPSTSMPDRDWWQTLWPNPKDVVLSLGVQPSMSVIDLCCGDGYFTVPLSQVTSRVYGIELDADLLEQAQKEGSANKVENCRWIQGDAMNISSLVPEPVDYVLLANTLHGIPEKEALAKSVAAILKPEGQFAVINWHKIPREETTVLGLPRGPKTDMRMFPDQVNDILSPLGFVLREIVKLPPYHYGAIFKKLLKNSMTAS